jgi:hypothetical protein
LVVREVFKFVECVVERSATFAVAHINIIIHVVVRGYVVRVQVEICGRCPIVVQERWVGGSVQIKINTVLMLLIWVGLGLRGFRLGIVGLDVGVRGELVVIVLV